MSDFDPKGFGKYTLLDRIGSGGMAELFLAKMKGDAGFEKIIAIKRILPNLVTEKKLVDAFISEARLAAYLQHENIVRTFDFGTMGDDYFIAMDYYFGKNLRAVTDKAAEISLPMSLVNILYIITQVLVGLEYAHETTDFQGNPLKLVHRDISPQNILLTYNGQVKIIDFGVAKAASQVHHTQFGAIKGKLSYMAPEQANGRPVDQRSDIFSVGAVLYELLTGKRLYCGETLEILDKARNAVFPPIREDAPNHHPRLYDILEKALAKNPADRYNSCGKMLSDIDDCIWELSFRTSAKGLSRYLNELFSDVIPEEEAKLRKLAGVSIIENGAAAKGVAATAGQAAAAQPKPPPPPVRALRPKIEVINKKICLLGAKAVGKTSLLRRFTQNVFSETAFPTVSAAVEKKPLNFEGRRILLNIWDMCGKDQIEDVNLDDLNKADGYILVADCTRASSMDRVEELGETARKALGEVPFVCVVNKSDLNLQWEIDRQALNELSGKGWNIIRTSAKTGVGVSRAFMSLVESLLHS